jgi:hypothetical protein
LSHDELKNADQVSDFKHGRVRSSVTETLNKLGDEEREPGTTSTGLRRPVNCLDTRAGAPWSLAQSRNEGTWSGCIAARYDSVTTETAEIVVGIEAFTASDIG